MACIAQVCICGKPGDKKCGGCKMKWYCSYECQGADYSKHQEWCEMMAFQMNSESSATSSNRAVNLLPRLPSLLAANRRPQAPPSNPVLPLEQFIPWFVVLATTHLQFQVVQMIAPLIAV